MNKTKDDFLWNLAIQFAKFWWKEESCQVTPSNLIMKTWLHGGGYDWSDKFREYVIKHLEHLRREDEEIQEQWMLAKMLLVDLESGLERANLDRAIQFHTALGHSLDQLREKLKKL